MFDKVLIANRGAIACRIIRTLKKMGVRSVAVYSEADARSLHVQMADEAVCIGTAAAADSYLRGEHILEVARSTGAQAIHPGYGFLSENAGFAEQCAQAGVVFIGPTPDQMRRFGLKHTAREIAEQNGVPLLPGSGLLGDVGHAHAEASRIGYPVMIKSTAGGGGIGMRLCWSADELNEAFQSVERLARANFKDAGIYLEKYVEHARHIEVQILADSQRNIIDLGERDCSIQRRHQKLVEESPSPFVDASLRRKMGRAARHAAEAVNYVTVGTVEFLVDKSGHFYFMEMNTRIQVEHPVTEVITGLDLVKEQIRLAAGERLTFDSSDIVIRGHAIECRVNAEDPAKDFMPCPGKIGTFLPPGGPGIRVESHLYSGYTIPSFYDSLIAKVIALGSNRSEAIARMARALDEMVIEGVQTTIPLHKKIMAHDYFHKGDVYTDFLPKHIFGGE